MTPERWQRLEALYHAALERPPSGRPAFLAGACPDDETLRHEVESLLDEPESHDGFLAQPAALRAAAMMSDGPVANMTGRSIGRYELRRLIGAGGMGEVYHSHDATLGRDVAVKILPQAFTGNPDRLARLEREARMLAALHHPNICGIYGIEEVEGTRLLLLEFVDGVTLAEKIASTSQVHPGHPGLPLPEALTFAHQIADALEAAHEKGIIHRDLKPANVKITADGVVKVLDFGLAKSVSGSDSSPDLTQAPEDAGQVGGPVIGTAAYMSPEQARGMSVDRRTDIWAFGCVLYEMLTGRLAFAGETVSDTIAKILEREPDWSALPPATPAPVRRLLFRCLTKDPRQRVRDIGDVRIEIAAIADPDPLSSEGGVSSAPTRARAWLPWIGLVLLATGGIVFEVRRPGAGPANPLATATFSKLTNWEGTEGQAAISPDGKFVAFLSDAAGEFDVWVHQIGTSNFVNFTTDLAPMGGLGILRTLGISGDGEVWFAPPGQERGPKLLMPLTGGARRPILGAAANALSWSSDGTRLVYFHGARGDPMFVADHRGADPVQILPPDHEELHNHNPVWSTDDQWIYFLRGSIYGLDETDELDVWRIRPAGGAPERLTKQNTDIAMLAPLDAHRLLYVARDQDRSGPWIWELDVDTRISRRVSAGLEQYTSVSASRDGRRVVATLGDPSATLWRLPLDRLAEERDVQPYPVPTPRALAPRFGGQSLFYLSSTGAGDGLWRWHEGQVSEIWKGSDGSLSEAPAVSRDGRHIAMVLRREGKQHLAIMAVDGTDRRVLAPSIEVKGAPDWSPDGASIVTGGRDAEPALFTIPVNGGPPVRLVTGETRDPVWSANANMIVYAGRTVAGQVPLLAVRPDGTPVALPPVLVRPGGYRFLPDGSGLVYLRGTGHALDFWLLDLRTSTTRPLTRLANRGRLRTFDITPDGKQLVFDRSQLNSDVVLIDIPRK